jgi:autotransporter-associated beta strand protein
MSRTNSFRIIGLLVLLVSAISTPAGHATTYTWIGPSGNSFWSNPSNWQGNTFPSGSNTDIIVFNNTGTSAYTANNNLADPLALNELDLNNNGSLTETLTGGGLSFQGLEPTINDNGSGNFNLTIGSIAINSVNSSFTPLTLGGNGAGTVYLCPITGSGDVEKSFSSTYVLSNQNSFSGQFHIFGGTILADTMNDANTNGAFGNASSNPYNLRFHNNATIELTAPSGTTTRGFDVSNGGGTLKLDFGNLTLAGQLISDATVNPILTKTGVGELFISGSDDNTSFGLDYEQGVLVLEKNSSSTVHAIGGPFTIAPSATVFLAGSGGDQIASGVTVTVNGTFDLYGQNEGFQALAGSGTVTNTATGASTLTVGENTQSGDTDTFTGTFTGNVGGALTLFKTGLGTLTIGGSADNNALAATVDSGTLVLAKTSSSSVHAIGQPLTINSGGTVQLAGTGGDQIYTADTVTNNGTFDMNGQSEGFKFLFGSGTVTNTSTSSDSTVTLGENTAAADSDTFSGPITAGNNFSVALNKVGNGTLTLAGTTDNVSLGGEVKSGTLILAKTSSNTVHAIGRDLAIDSGATVQLGGTGGDQIYTGVNVTDNGTLDLNGQNEGFRSLLGAGTVKNSGSGGSTLTVGENTQSGDTDTFTGTLLGNAGGALTLYKTGDGALIIGGSVDNNALNATVNTGTLVLAKSSSATVHAIGGPLLINSGGTVQLAGSGGDQIYTAVTVTNNGTLDMNGQNEGFQNLIGSGTVKNTGGSAATLTVGENTQSSDIDSFTGNFIGNVGGPLSLYKTGGVTFTLGGSTDNNSLNATVNTGTLVLAKTSSSTVHSIGGPLLINPQGKVQLGGSGGDQIYTLVTVTNNGTLDMNGQNEGFQSLLGLGNVTNSSSTASTLTLGENTQSSDAATFGGFLSGSGDGNLNLYKTGAGTLTLSGGDDNSFLHATVNSGTLILAKTSGTIVHALGGSGAVLTVNQTGTVQLAGTGEDQIFYKSNVLLNGTLDLNGHLEGFDGLNGSGLVTDTDSGTSSTLVVGQNDNAQGPATFSGKITDGKGQVSLYKAGNGTQILSGQNTFSGLTGVFNGTLVLASAGALPTGSMVSVTNGAALVVDADSTGGTVLSTSGTTTIAAGATLTANNFSLGTVGGLTMQLGGPTVAANAKLNVNGALNLAAKLTVSLVNNFQPRLGDSFDLMDWGSLSGTFAALNLPALAGGLHWSTSQLYINGTISVGGLLGDYNQDGVVDAADYTVWRDTLGSTTDLRADGNDNGVIDQGDFAIWKAHFGEHTGSGSGSASPVPEPSTTAMVLTAAILLAARRGTRMVQLN